MDALKILRRSRAVFPLAVLAATAMLFTIEGSYWQSVGALDHLAAQREARFRMLELHKHILDADNGQRGYLLTGREEYLLPYQASVEPISELLKTLHAHYGDDSDAQRALDKMEKLVRARLTQIAEAIALKRSGKSDRLSELVLTGFAREQMDQIEVIGKELLVLSTASITQSRASIDRALLFGRIASITLTALSLLALYFYLRNVVVAAGLQRELNRINLVERDRLEILVAQRTESLTRLTRHLLTAREDERHRLARNLHDDLGALLTSAKLDAARIKARLAGAPPDTQELLAHQVQTLNASVALGRSIIEDLHPSTLANLGLVPALEILAREFGAQSGVLVHCALVPVKLKPSAELMVFRLVQEATTNSSKYAKAQQMWIELSAQDGQVRVSVRDDGVGFEEGLAERSAHGLLGMRFRVEAENGQMTLTSAPGQGTHIVATLPESA